MIDLDIWKKAWALLDSNERRNAWIVLGVLAFAALSSAAMVGSVMPFLMVLAEPSRISTNPLLAWAYATFGFASNYEFLVALGIGSLVVILLANFIQILRTYAVARFATMRIHTLSSKLLASYLRQPYEFFLNIHSGTISTRILAESEQVVGQFFRPLGEVMASGLSVLAIIVLLVWVDPVVAVICFGVIGGVYGITLALNRRLLARLGETRVAANSARYRIATEALGGIKDIKLLGRERAYVDTYREPSRRVARTQLIAAIIGDMPQFVVQAVAFSGILLLCLVLLDPAGLDSGAALGGLLPLLGVFAFAGQRMLPELNRFYRGLTDLRFGAAAVEAIYNDLTDMASGPQLPHHSPEPLGLSSELYLDNISYRYPKAERAGLNGVSLRIRAGEKIGVVGSTGAGKTTLADLVLGLLRATDGEMRVDGKPITEANLRAWQQSIGYVPQEIFLTDASVAENIALGAMPGEIDWDRVRTAACIAQLDRFIREELPQGYDTRVGERGVRLSGGQRQRIGIARALYHDADLIVLDEATSALDNLTEREVMLAIEALPGDKTVLMIAHRLSTVQRCDKIIVMEAGRLSDIGTWEELMARSQAFRNLAAAA